MTTVLVFAGTLLVAVLLSGLVLFFEGVRVGVRDLVYACWHLPGRVSFWGYR